MTNDPQRGPGQETELVVAIFRTALVLVAGLAPMLGATAHSERAYFTALLAGLVFAVAVFAVWLAGWDLHGARIPALAVDVVLVACWTILTWQPGPGAGQGGSPLFPLSYVVVVSAALWFGIRGAMAAATALATLYLYSVYLLTGDSFVVIDCLFRDSLFVFLVAVSAGYLSDSSGRSRESWSRSQELLTQYQERFRAAQEMYALLVPAQPPPAPGLDVAARWRPALLEGGGDFYDIISPAPGRILIVVADVSGKAISGALKIPFLKAAVLAVARLEDDPGAILREVNRILYPYLQPEMFISACVAVIDVLEGRLRIANAGHDPPILVRRANHDVRVFQTGSIVLGAVEDAEYPTIEDHLALHDVLCLYTDGVTEARNTAGEEFGFDTFLARVEAATRVDYSAQKTLDNIFAALHAHVGRQKRHDDTTLLVVRYHPSEAAIIPPEAPPPAADGAPPPLPR